jgi:chemotaxis protein CheC
MPHLHSSIRAEYLQTIFATATREASAAMCRWTLSKVSMQLESVNVVPIECVSDEYGLGGEPLALVVLSLDGGMGDFILAFGTHSARELAASLLHREPNQNGVWSELEKSALKETGNILGCAYTSAIARLIDADLIPSPPTFLEDYAASVLEQSLSTQAMICDDLMICRTRFEIDGKALDWNVFFIASAELREAIGSAAARQEIDR